MLSYLPSHRNPNFRYKISIDTRQLNSDLMVSFLGFNFMRRDYDFGRPKFNRVYSDENHRVHYQFTLVELAQAFMRDFRSEDLAEQLEKYATDCSKDDNLTEMMVKDVANMDNLFKYGFLGRLVFDKRREFFTLYVEGEENQALARKIPKKFWSKTKLGPYPEDYGDSELSPLLKVPRSSEENEFLRNIASSTLKRFRDSTLTEQIPGLEEKLFTNWDHPIIIFPEDYINLASQRYSSGDKLKEQIRNRYGRFSPSIRQNPVLISNNGKRTLNLGGINS